ncbi:MAG: hypothetical protein Q4F17_02390 [Eubacteriales bacterium]|nr:hypothetical protein [Eubacteriales bacterium]
MARKKFASLTGIDNNRPISSETDGEFLFQLQKGLLLALRDDGLLTQMQYRYAEDKLKQQRGGRNDSGSKLLPGVHRQGGPGQFL